jgi:acylphosphatase
MKNYKFIISGKVQKVSYRIYTFNNASKFNGYVKNLSNGDVEACVTCYENDLDTFIEILKKGSPNSRVDNIKQIEIDDTFTNGFKIQK